EVQHESYWGNVNPIGIRSCYDEGKRVAETLCMDYFRQDRVQVKIARIFNTYGPQMATHDGRVVSNFIVQALRNEDITLYGDGSQTRSFCYVDDTVEALTRVLALPPDQTGPVNVGNPSPIAVKDLAQRILELCDSRSKISFKPLPGDDPKKRCPDIARARDWLGWAPTTDLEAGLRKTIEYFEEKLKQP
ncbi:MAG: GDP-mannose 4,6-dehydratase, partial [Phycisphaerales bacterium]|nr:GDP-mannose 4,6-dehydratase [Phycisphaerales bacterium]